MKTKPKAAEKPEAVKVEPEIDVPKDYAVKFTAPAAQTRVRSANVLLQLARTAMPKRRQELIDKAAAEISTAEKLEGKHQAAEAEAEAAGDEPDTTSPAFAKLKAKAKAADAKRRRK